jgi:hypothetical protein
MSVLIDTVYAMTLYLLQSHSNSHQVSCMFPIFEQCCHLVSIELGCVWLGFRVMCVTVTVVNCSSAVI